VLKKHRIPPSYGFIVARQLERDPDGAAALQIWVDGGNPLGNHTYTHLDLTKNSAEDFQREILRNEPVLELLMAPVRKPWAARTMALVPLPVSARGRHPGKTPRGARLPVDQRLPHRADHARLRGLSLEQRVRALLDAQGRSIHRCGCEELPHAARDFTRFQIQNSRAYSAATSTM
jgi:hypothetical protein